MKRVREVEGEMEKRGGKEQKIKGEMGKPFDVRAQGLKGKRWGMSGGRREQVCFRSLSFARAHTNGETDPKNRTRIQISF